MKSLALKEDASSRLLAQAVQASQREARIRKEKKRKKDKGDGLKRLVELLQGKKKKRKKKKRSDGEKRRDRGTGATLSNQIPKEEPILEAAIQAAVQVREMDDEVEIKAKRSPSSAASPL